MLKPQLLRKDFELASQIMSGNQEFSCQPGEFVFVKTTNVDVSLQAKDIKTRLLISQSFDV